MILFDIETPWLTTKIRMAARPPNTHNFNVEELCKVTCKMVHMTCPPCHQPCQWCDKLFPITTQSKKVWHASNKQPMDIRPASMPHTNKYPYKREACYITAHYIYMYIYIYVYIYIYIYIYTYVLVQCCFCLRHPCSNITHGSKYLVTPIGHLAPFYPSGLAASVTGLAVIAWKIHLQLEARHGTQVGNTMPGTERLTPCPTHMARGC